MIEAHILGTVYETPKFVCLLLLPISFPIQTRYSQTSIIRSVRDRQIFFELSIVRIFEIGTSRKCSVVFIQY